LHHCVISGNSKVITAGLSWNPSQTCHTQ